MEKTREKFPPSCPRCCPLPRGTKSRVQAYGVFRRASSGLVIQRYKCFGCERTVSDATLTHEYRQRKRDINEKLFKQLVSLTSMRRSAILIGVSRKTVER
jgi:transposase-like protein